MEFILVENVGIVMRQTNYTKEEAEQKLSLHNNNVLDTVREYLNIKENVKSEEKNMRNILKQTKPIQQTIVNK